MFFNVIFFIVNQNRRTFDSAESVQIIFLCLCVFFSADQFLFRFGELFSILSLTWNLFSVVDFKHLVDEKFDASSVAYDVVEIKEEICFFSNLIHFKSVEFGIEHLEIFHLHFIEALNLLCRNLNGCLFDVFHHVSVTVKSQSHEHMRMVIKEF